MEQRYNMRSPGIKRLMREAIELSEPTEQFCANPLEDNIFEWHFTVRGPPNTDFEEGMYHGRIILPTQYPMKPPDIILLTPNGRFEVNKKICLSISGHHPESWQPSWSIRTALLALIAFMPTKTIGAIGSLDYSPEERKLLARKSKNWVCDICGKNADLLTLHERENVIKEKPIEHTLMHDIVAATEKIDNPGSIKIETPKPKLFEVCAPSFDEITENVIEQEEPPAPLNESTLVSINIVPMIIFCLAITISVLVFRRFMVFSIYGND